MNTGLDHFGLRLKFLSLAALLAVQAAQWRGSVGTRLAIGPEHAELGNHNGVARVSAILTLVLPPVLLEAPALAERFLAAFWEAAGGNNPFSNLERIMAP